jgi:hypothetical protein
VRVGTSNKIPLQRHSPEKVSGHDLRFLIKYCHDLSSACVLGKFSGDRSFARDFA